MDSCHMKIKGSGIQYSWMIDLLICEYQQRRDDEMVIY